MNNENIFDDNNQGNDPKCMSESDLDNVSGGTEKFDTKNMRIAYGAPKLQKPVIKYGCPNVFNNTMKIDITEENENLEEE